MTEEQQKSFEEAARPLIKWLNNNTHPHTHVLVDSTSAELVEGQISFNTTDYLVD